MEGFYLEGGVDHAGGCCSQCLSQLRVLGARDGRGEWLEGAGGRVYICVQKAICFLFLCN